MNRPYRLLAVLFALFLAGCSTYQVSTDYDPSKDFLTLHTWNWLPDQRAGQHQQEAATNDLTYRRIQAAISDELQLRGYKQVSKKPQFYVAYHLVVENKQNTVTTVQTYGGFYYGYPGWAPFYTEARTYTYKVGTLLIDFIDPVTHHTIWQGTVQSVLPEQSMTPVQREQQVRQAVQKVLNKFPPV